MGNCRLRCPLVHIARIFCLLICVFPGYIIWAETAVHGGEHSNVIVLFDALPVSRYKASLIVGQFGLSLAQRDELHRYGRSLIEAHQQFLSDLRQLDIETQLNHDFTYLLNGVAITIHSKDIDRLLALPGAGAIYPDSVVHLELAESVPLIGADQVWQMTDSQQRPITGQGIRVAVIDTGIDYTHPDLGGCFGQECKVVDGFDQDLNVF